MKSLVVLIFLLGGGYSAFAAPSKSVNMIAAANAANDHCRKEAIAVAKFNFDQRMQNSGLRGRIIEDSVKLVREDDLNGTWREYTVSAEFGQTRGEITDRVIVTIFFDGCAVESMSMDFDDSFYKK